MLRRYLLVPIAALAACGGSGHTTSSSASCADAVRLHGEWLVGTTADRVRAQLPALGGTVRVRVPPCQDTNHAQPELPRTEKLRRLRGIAPAIALVRAEHGRAQTLLIGEDFLVALPSHPLHRAVFGSDARPVATHGRCRPASRQTGRIGQATLGDDAIVVGGHRWVVDARTAVDAPGVDGTPRMQPGLRVRVDGVRCSGGRRVARRIAAT